MAVNIGPFQQIVALNMGKNDIRHVVFIAGDAGDVSVFPPPPFLEVITDRFDSWAWPNVTDTYPDVPSTNEAIRARIDSMQPEDGYFIAFQDQEVHPGPGNIMPLVIFALVGKWINDNRDFAGDIHIQSISRVPSSGDDFFVPVTANMSKDDLLEVAPQLEYIG